MPDKIQHTAASLQQKMSVRYNDGLHHKHNKNHLEYRMHCRSHPHLQKNIMDEELFNGSTGLLRELKLKKMRKRVYRGQIH